MQYLNSDSQCKASFKQNVNFKRQIKKIIIIIIGNLFIYSNNCIKRIDASAEQTDSWIFIKNFEMA